MKKAAILTFFRPLNYGAVLQAYASTLVLQKHFGIYAELIDYRLPKTEYYRNWFRPGEYGKLSKKPISLVKRIGADVLFAARYQKQKRGFDKFISDRMPVTQNAFCSAGELDSIASKYDYYFVGSDLVWNPEMTSGIDPIFFLSFADEKKKKIAYAASIGTTNMPGEYLAVFQKELKHLDSISVRERSAVSLLQPLTDRKVHEVLDPTLLTNAEDWSKLLNDTKRSAGKYVVSFMLEYSDTLIETVKRIAKERDLKIVHFDLKNYYGARKTQCAFDADPGEFLAILKNAQCVVTNSFHGCAFSLIFQRELWCIPHTTRGTRMIELLNHLGLEPFILNRENQYDQKRKIDYAAVDQRLNAMKLKSMDYLAGALEE